VTGGSRGIGRATARPLSQRGAAVCVNCTVNSDAAQALVVEITTGATNAGRLSWELILTHWREP